MKRMNVNWGRGGISSEKKKNTKNKATFVELSFPLTDHLELIETVSFFLSFLFVYFYFIDLCF